MSFFPRTLSIWVATSLALLALSATSSAQHSAPRRTVLVIAPKADVKACSTVVATVRMGKRFYIQRNSGSWYLLTVSDNNRTKRGWIHRDHVLLEPALTREEWKQVRKAKELGRTAGRLHSSMGDYSQALPLYRQALAIKMELLGEKHPDTAASVNNLALLHYDMGDYSQAFPLYALVI